mmetsp:Transcript_15261/g.44109  ORF Transcript_15261/g.44109 Transcript_15261/m.44109 type:complete len:360 (+) Transcript_15261:672-1751(+)
MRTCCSSGCSHKLGFTSTWMAPSWRTSSTTHSIQRLCVTDLNNNLVPRTMASSSDSGDLCGGADLRATSLSSFCRLTHCKPASPSKRISASPWASTSCTVPLSKGQSLRASALSEENSSLTRTTWPTRSFASRRCSLSASEESASTSVETSGMSGRPWPSVATGAPLAAASFSKLRPATFASLSGCALPCDASAPTRMTLPRRFAAAPAASVAPCRLSSVSLSGPLRPRTSRWQKFDPMTHWETSWASKLTSASPSSSTSTTVPSEPTARSAGSSESLVNASRTRTASPARSSTSSSTSASISYWSTLDSHRPEHAATSTAPSSSRTAFTDVATQGCDAEARYLTGCRMARGTGRKSRA